MTLNGVLRTKKFLNKKFFNFFRDTFDPRSLLSWIKILKSPFFQVKTLFFKNFDFRKRCKNEIEANNEKRQPIQLSIFPQNRFGGLSSSQRPSASVGVNINF